MTQDLEFIRDQWINAYYLGDIQQLTRYEHPELKIIYADKGLIECGVGRYEKIVHAVKNGVWKPQKPNISIEEFEFDHHHSVCKVTLKFEDLELVAEETWVFQQKWMLQQLKIY